MAQSWAQGACQKGRGGISDNHPLHPIVFLKPTIIEQNLRSRLFIINGNIIHIHHPEGHFYVERRSEMKKIKKEIRTKQQYGNQDPKMVSQSKSEHTQRSKSAVLWENEKSIKSQQGRHGR